jgi:hypothetical protein
MGMDVDEAGGNELAARIKLLCAAPFHLAHRHDPTVPNRDIRLAAIAVHHGSAADHRINFSHGLSRPRLSESRRSYAANQIAADIAATMSVRSQFPQLVHISE